MLKFIPRRFQYRVGYAIGYWQHQIRPRLRIQYIRGYVAGKMGW